MSIIATAVKHLLAAGVTGDALVQAIADMEEAAVPVIDVQAERRRAKDRERKRLRNSAETAESVQAPPPASAPLVPPLSPAPLSPPIIPPPSPPTPDILRGRAAAKPDDARFAEFWAAYPRRTGKEAARKAWCQARKRDASPDHIIAAAKRYAAHPPDDAQFIPHPATWLNQGRYDDEPMETSNGNGHMGRNGSPATGQYRASPGLEWAKRQFALGDDTGAVEAYAGP